MMPSKRSTMPENLAQLDIRKVSMPNWLFRPMLSAATASDRPPSNQATG
jgi:hypothetical protein